MTDAIGWTLIHSLWEGGAIAVLLGMVLLFLRRSSAQARYVASCAALLLILASAVYTFLRLPVARPAQAVLATGGPGGAIAHAAVPISAASAVEAYLPWITLAWLAGVAVLSIRWTVSCALLRGRSRRQGTVVPAAVCAALDRVRARMGITRPITVRAADWLSSPAVTGWLRPVLLLPASAITGLTPDQLTAILAHELAHVRRYDYLVNLVQTAVETLLFYHPAVWWISRQIRIEREHCCDDAAVKVCDDRLLYAQALLELARGRQNLPELAMAAAGGALRRRIHRILYGREAVNPAWPVTILVVAAAVACLWGGQRIAAQSPNLSPPYLKWVSEDVTYIISDQERAAFLKLASDREAEHFIEQFWLQRDPTPGTPANEFKEEHYRRIAYSNARFSKGGVPGWKTDRGRMYIVYGPPDEIESHPTQAHDAWRYRLIEGVGTNVVFDFFDDRLVSRSEHERRLTFADQRFGAGGQAGSQTDRGRIYVLYGPPDEIESHPDRQSEQWLYHTIPGLGANVLFQFQNGRLIK